MLMVKTKGVFLKKNTLCHALDSRKEWNVYWSELRFFSFFARIHFTPHTSI